MRPTSSIPRTPGFGATILLLGVVACGDPAIDSRRPSHVEATLSEDIETVVKLAWQTQEPTRGYVEYGTTPEFGLRTPLEADATSAHDALLLGLPQETLIYYRVVSWDGDSAGASESGRIETGRIPGGIPEMEVEGDGHSEFVLVPVLGNTSAVTIINPAGDIVWYHTEDRDLDFYRARLSLDGTSVIYNAASVSGDPAEDSELVKVALDGSETTSIPVPLLAHDFVEFRDGDQTVLAAIVVEYRDVDGNEIRGDKIVEIDAEGEQKTVFSVWDCFDPAVDQGDSGEQGWTFANALDYDSGEDAYYLGLRNFSSIVKVSRATGECEWVLGTTASSFDFASGSARFLHQHQFQVRGDRILVMDNDGALETESRVLEYELDVEAGVATQVWSYVADPSVYTFVLGEPQRFSDGSTFINWSAAGQLERLDENDERVWKLNTRAGYVFGFHQLADTLYAEP
ncbi:MAG TPA: aryl-sulfate sulfotransferase [Polyangiaceae bacterium]